jgi:hypothetical protein
VVASIAAEKSVSCLSRSSCQPKATAAATLALQAVRIEAATSCSSSVLRLLSEVCFWSRDIESTVWIRSAPLQTNTSGVLSSRENENCSLFELLQMTTAHTCTLGSSCVVDSCIARSME